MEPRSVLVVEDEPLLRELMAAALESRGFIAFHGGGGRRQAGLSAQRSRWRHHRRRPWRGTKWLRLGNVFGAWSSRCRSSFLTNLPDPRFADRDAEGIGSGIAYLRKSRSAISMPAWRPWMQPCGGLRCRLAP
jgi:CheY-like chemotaxis protein